MSEIRKRAIEGIKINDTFTVVRTFTEQDMMQFADITKDYNAIHFDDRFAKVKNLRGRICHGLLVAGMITQVGGQIGWLASRFDLRFMKPVYFGDTITCRLTVDDIDEKGWARATAVFQNQEGTTVLEGNLEGVLPGAAERKVLEVMVDEGDPTNRFE
ncbi:MAG: MaoC family dehydratase [Deltaproteobacteria bacterium]|nr:MaoC family dehydratase [Deltaproteobacteria bacterium]MBW2119157.1 MaoC family dehydratase [Deltaproteobacteria bacterium]MBW2344365.1 MaoC family dehydratase [Deltaproteobacteria bacterium]